MASTGTVRFDINNPGPTAIEEANWLNEQFPGLAIKPKHVRALLSNHARFQKSPERQASRLAEQQKAAEAREERAAAVEQRKAESEQRKQEAETAKEQRKADREAKAAEKAATAEAKAAEPKKVVKKPVAVKADPSEVPAKKTPVQKPRPRPAAKTQDSEEF